MPHPLPETILKHGLLCPGNFTRESFSDTIVKAHSDCSVNLLETAVFLEPHASGKMHLNCVVRAEDKYRWKKVAEQLCEHAKMRVNFGSNVRTWVEGIVYGAVASEHKLPESLDKSPYQWAKSGDPVKFSEILPRKWQADGFTRRSKLTPLAVLNLCREHSITTEEQIWALALDFESKSDRALLSYLMESDVAGTLAKVDQALTAKEKLRRGQLTRIQILEEYEATKSCKCRTPGLCYNLMKDCLVKNGIDGEFQSLIAGALRVGRAKQRNICILGSTNMAKSYLMKPLTMIYTTYRRPDGGTHQLEKIIGKEIVFLNDFEYDDDAKRWLAWSYLKNMMEGEKLDVARPKNRGAGNLEWTDTSPIFITAPQRVTQWSLLPGWGSLSVPRNQ